MAQSHVSGPLLVGDRIYGDIGGPNQGFVRCAQSTTITQNSTAAVTSIVYLPPGAVITSFDVDVLTAYNSATSAILSIGTAAAGTQYVTSVDCKAATGRIAVTYTAAQLAAMSGQSVLGVANPIAGPVYITITVVGATSAGFVNVTVNYFPAQVN